MFVLCDCESGMILDMICYTGSDVDVPKVGNRDPMGMSGAIVKKMMAPTWAWDILCILTTGIPALLSHSTYMTTRRDHVVL